LTFWVCPWRWTVAVYVALLAATLRPLVGLSGLRTHSRDPPEYGAGLVTVPVIVVLPEVIVNGIESVSVLEICGVMRAETMAVAGFAGVASVNDPAYGPVAGPAAVKVTDATPLKQLPLPPPAMNVVEVA